MFLTQFLLMLTSCITMVFGDLNNMADIDNKEQCELDQDLDDVEEVEEEETGEETKIKARQLTVQMMQNPQILAALQERLDGLVETPTGYIESIKEELKEKAKIEDEKKDEEKEDPKGIPEFWLTVFKNVDLLSDMVQEHDEPILKHLKDIKVKFSDAGQPMCQIDWKKGKNVTLKTIKKKQKHKGRGTVRTVTKTVSNDSFFNFFAPPEVPESGDLDDDAEAILAADFEIGHFLRERIIPRSVLYFTGEAIEDDDDDYDEEGEEADEGYQLFEEVKSCSKLFQRWLQ
ncbi:PREDICTED: nucleosome assembly protein 1-like 1 [Propithecus coquereli]|uniref:nucleosome assembly protein 1-like 1 n=1 Tax=Propithecus coquereli TaxID=379532 RepID=UPI00063F1329|nr:PREDICTED: nucleosome assembly protein 1-like 1 [Propithecus coquereli]